ncbi:hypothetical protein B4923_00675 [Brenneria roseae subsp. americana]|uniref:Uncharacterized protein n=1 Tax=Brenneria roseae subsp. americana TaxID=1508507 RepID=A0A2U1U1Y8_9GAMM|nr:hypothetical protein [Brenneria roseae]PWC15665.1 hypothetical protein B4923_00675 [Brenneria roseae subsp. americana]
MTNRNHNLNADRLIEPRRRELPAGGMEIAGLAGVLGGIWSAPADNGGQDKQCKADSPTPPQ